MASLESLGYTPEEIQMLAPQVRDMIGQKRLKKPRSGIPNEWLAPQHAAAKSSAPPKTGTSLLQDAARMNEENTEIGAGVVNQLHSQTQQLEHVDQTVVQIQEDADHALGLLGTIRYRLYREKGIAYTIMLILLGVDGFMAYTLSAC
mmetsp:Transcript_10954/g.31423  ORF Transcript_10954/g.31423 Transcript_10954/m.31423 type:complete len:147 (-) Transcript_10954:240-680(-)